MSLDPRYPVGRFEWAGPANTPEQRQQYIAQIGAAPMMMRQAVRGLTPEQFDTPYRDGGWTVRQVVHHVPDSHMNAYVRFKLALTEDDPTIKPYAEARWAELGDSKVALIETSLLLLDCLHLRWITLLMGMKPEQFARNYRHPEMGLVPLDKALAMYAWHSRHHCAHITSLRERMGWK